MRVGTRTKATTASVAGLQPLLPDSDSLGRPPDPEELPARPLLPGRRALRVLGGHDQGTGPRGPLGLHRRGAQEKTYGELKGEFVFETGATFKLRSQKRTYAFAFRSMRTMRFLLITRAGRLARIDGRSCASPRTRQPKPSTTAWLMPWPRNLSSD